METERRYAELILRAAGDENKPKIEGEAAVFNTETSVGSWFREKIRPGAFTRVLSESPDVIAAFNHDWNYVLGRTTAGTLKLEETRSGLNYVIYINPNDPQAMSVYEKVKRGDVSQSSFAFTVRKGKEEWTNAEKGGEGKLVKLPLREIVEIDQLFDVGPVPFAQYPEASAEARSKSEEIQPDEITPAASDGAEEVKARQQARLRRIELENISIHQ